MEQQPNFSYSLDEIKAALASPQATFDFVVKHLAKQGGPSRCHGSCRYRLGKPAAGEHVPSMWRCAAGALIRDDDYDPSIEGQAVHSILRIIPQDYHDEFQDQYDVIRALQHAHDLSGYGEEEGKEGWRWVNPWKISAPGEHLHNPNANDGIATHLEAVAKRFHLDPKAVQDAWPYPEA